MVCALRRATNVALDDLTFVVTHFLPHLNRDSIWRILKAEGLNRRCPAVTHRPARGTGQFRDYDLGFIHLDIKQLPKLQTADGKRRKRYLFVAIDRCSRSVHLAVKDDMTTKSAIGFLREAAAAFPFRITHLLTDNGSCFSPAFEKVCAEPGASTATPAPTRRRPMAWWNASTAASRARCWASPFIRTVISNSCSAASTPPTTAAASASWTAGHPIRSSPNASPPDASCEAPNPPVRPVHRTSPKLASSLKLPRRSRNQTPSQVPDFPVDGRKVRTLDAVAGTTNGNAGAPVVRMAALCQETRLYRHQVDVATITNFAAARMAARKRFCPRSNSTSADRRSCSLMPGSSAATASVGSGGTV